MKRLPNDTLLWIVFIITLIIGFYFAFSGIKPTSQTIMLQLLGIGCGLIALVRRRRKQ